MDEESSTQRFRVLMAGISEGETRILYNIEKGRLTADILKSNSSDVTGNQPRPSPRMACASYPRSPKARQTVQSDYTSATAKRCSAKPDRERPTHTRPVSKTPPSNC